MMRSTTLTACLVVGLSFTLASCGEPPEKPKADAKPAAKADAELEAAIKANLAKLSPEDRKLAEAQRFCAVEGEESRLGSMDVPIKLMIKGKPVFICCGGCKKQALAEADKTLARAEEFRAKSKSKTAK
jgi:hypothetical protein